MYLPKQLNMMIFDDFFKARIIIHLMLQLARRVTYHRDPTCVTRHGTSLVATRALVETVLAPTAAPGRATTAPTRSSATPSRSGAGSRAGRRQRCGGDATVGWFRYPGDTQLRSCQISWGHAWVNKCSQPLHEALIPVASWHQGERLSSWQEQFLSHHFCAGFLEDQPFSPKAVMFGRHPPQQVKIPQLSYHITSTVNTKQCLDILCYSAIVDFF